MKLYFRFDQFVLRMASKKRRLDSGSDSDIIKDSDNDLEDEESGQRTVRVKRNAAHDEFTTYIKKLDGGKQELRSQCKHCTKKLQWKKPNNSEESS